MKRMGCWGLTTLFVIFVLVFMGYAVSADDTCVFLAPTDNLPSNMLLSPTGSDVGIDETPMVGTQQDAVKVPNSDIPSKTIAYMAPVVPAARTVSGDKIYMAFFKPGEENFWEGNVTKFGISANNQIVDANGDPATWPNGAMKDSAVPYWATTDWADNTLNTSRIIYTCLDGNNLTSFDDANSNLKPIMFGNPTTRTTAEIINYVRGADVLDEDGDGDTLENRAVITGDVLHSEPVIFQYRYTDGSSETVVYFGSNDGMLHAVFDEETPSAGHVPGREMWAFIPPDQLPRLKNMIEDLGHQYYVDATPRIYFKDDDGDGLVEKSNGDQVILVCGERKGGTGYFALDVTEPFSPKFHWRINPEDDSGIYGWAGPNNTISELGETWSEPQFGKVKTSAGDTVGTPVFFVGGGYSPDNSSGKAVIAVDVRTGTVVKKFTTGMNYSFPSTVRVIDENDNGFVDKVYVGDLGGQMWRFGEFTDGSGNPLAFPNCNEDISTWTAQVFFKTDSGNSRKFFYPPSVTLEKGYDMIFMGTGDRENACDSTSAPPNMIAAVKDTHSLTTIVGETDLVDVTDPTATPFDLTTDLGWYIRLLDDHGNAVGEKVLAEGVVFYKTFYITTFTPNDDPSLPGGDGKLYALSYLTGSTVLDFNNDGNNDRSVTIGGGIPSKPVILITRTGTKLLISVGSAEPGTNGPSTFAGIKYIDPLVPPINCFYRFWKDVF